MPGTVLTWPDRGTIIPASENRRASVGVAAAANQEKMVEGNDRMSDRTEFGCVTRRVVVALFLAVVVVCSSGFAQSLVVGLVLPSLDAGDELAQAVARSADEGATMAAEEHAFNAEMFGIDFDVFIERADDPASAVSAADRLVDEHGAFAIAGGFGSGVAAELASWSAKRDVPFLNVGNSSDALRHEACEPTMFHIEPSAAMYLDGLAGWYVRSGFRQWYVIHDEAGADQLERLRWSLSERHFGARIVGTLPIASGTTNVDTVSAAIRRSNADLVILLVSANDQLAWMAELDDAAIEVEVVGFPHTATQTRAFFEASRTVAPTIGAQHRGLAFEATLDAYGARELNARYRQRFDAPMEPPAWAVYQAVKVLFEAAFFTSSTEAGVILDHFAAPTTVFDVWKGIGTSFRPWDGQLRQSIYLVKISETATDPFQMGLLVGELPAIYMPGTDPLERLDQLGDLQAQSRCDR
jgi:ABC transporter substrate binding protein (PQQ-dependent alcohol dehydrogenase system)